MAGPSNLPCAVATRPAHRFGDFMKEALGDTPPAPFRAPPGIKMSWVNLKTGLRASAEDKDAIREFFKPNEEPDDAYSVVGIATTPGEGPSSASSGSGPPIPGAGGSSSPNGGGPPPPRRPDIPGIY